MQPSQEVTVEEVNDALDCLAGLSDFSSDSHQNVFLSKSKPMKTNMQRRIEILQPIVTRLRSRELKWLVRIILKNTLPVLLPINYTMASLHFALPLLYMFQNDIRTAAQNLIGGTWDFFLPLARPAPENLSRYTQMAIKLLEPTVGIPIKIPLAHKARVCYPQTRFENEY